MLAGLIFAVAAAASQQNPAAELCTRAAAVVSHASIRESDRAGCICADKQMRKLLDADDYQLYVDMMSIIASGADEKRFNKEMSDIMLKRGMDQNAANGFLARAHAAETKAQRACNILPDLVPGTAPGK